MAIHRHVGSGSGDRDGWWQSQCDRCASVGPVAIATAGRAGSTAWGDWRSGIEFAWAESQRHGSDPGGVAGGSIAAVAGSVGRDLPVGLHRPVTGSNRTPETSRSHAASDRSSIGQAIRSSLEECGVHTGLGVGWPHPFG